MYFLLLLMNELWVQIDTFIDFSIDLSHRMTINFSIDLSHRMTINFSIDLSQRMTIVMFSSIKIVEFS
jgi:hypothetical protein